MRGEYARVCSASRPGGARTALVACLLAAAVEEAYGAGAPWVEYGKDTAAVGGASASTIVVCRSRVNATVGSVVL